MNFEIKDGSEHLPHEEDVYGVNDIEERERFDALLGARGRLSDEERMRRRRLGIRLLAALVVVALTIAFASLGVRQMLGW